MRIRVYHLNFVSIFYQHESHEQSRPDRNEWIEIVYDNIEQSLKN